MSNMELIKAERIIFLNIFKKGELSMPSLYNAAYGIVAHFLVMKKLMFIRR